MIVLICLTLVLGFFLAWIIGIVANEEVSVSKSAVIVFLTAIVFFASFAAAQDLGIAGAIIPLSATMLAMAGLLRALAYIPFKKGMIVASVYSLIMVGAALAIG